MDVNGTQFQLLKGSADWALCTVEGDLPFATGTHVVWNSEKDALSLRPALTLFRHKKSLPLDPVQRRGAARDSRGNTFWIADDGQRLFWLPAGDDMPAVFWEQTVSPPTPGGAFQPSVPTVPEVFSLAGLAVTSHHYLVVGCTGTEQGVFLFDLSGGGPPLRLRFPADAPFIPFDMAADGSANVWILDRVHRTYWGLDREFRLLGKPSGNPVLPEEAPTFAPNPPESTGAVSVLPKSPTPLLGFPIEAANPIAIEALPDGTVLFLDNSPGSLFSTLAGYRLGDKIFGDVALIADIEAVIEGTTDPVRPLNVIGYDFLFLPGDTPATGTLFVVEQDGDQVIAFRVTLPAPPGVLTVQATETYLPLLYYGKRSLVVQDARVYYDVSVGIDHDQSTRWVPLQAIDQPRYDTHATLITPVFSGKRQDCIWHRLFLDLCLPPETGIQVWSRAANSLELLKNKPFLPEPALYRRSGGTEIAYYDPFPGSTDPDKGTYETVFQEAAGQYLQVRLEWRGNGRGTPLLYSARAYYPRFSYPRRYLPAVYLEDDTSRDFLERMLGNLEGFYSDIEGKIENVSVLFDGRSAPPDALDWLAGWVGLLLDPLWETIQQRRQDVTLALANAPSSNTQSSRPAPDRRRLLIRYARLLYERRGTPEGITFALHLLLDSCLETTGALLKTLAVLPQAVRDDAALVRQFPGLAALLRDLKSLGLPLPTPTTSDAGLEDLLYLFVIAPERISPIRLVEKFRTRAGRAAVAGDPTAADPAEQQTAHRFSVLVPQGLLPEEGAMVRRIVQLEKPAHTLFDVRLYWEGFRVGEARLGLETVLGESARYLPILLGQSVLREGILSARPPMDAPDRVIADRDRLGGLLPL